MKRIYTALSLAFLFFVTAIYGSTAFGQGLKQSYYTWEEDGPAIVGEIKNGGLWLTFYKDKITSVGLCDDDTYRLPNTPVKVKGILGKPKTFIIADIGQDYNPILCVLTNQGKVQMLSLWNTITTGDLEVTEIPMDGIVSFKAGPGGPNVDDEGEIFYEYTTIYGVDAQGGEHEVPLYFQAYELEYVTEIQGVDVVFQLYFSSDWKMRYVIGYYLSEKVQELQGHFWLVQEDWDNMVFTYGYELNAQLDFTGEGILSTDVDYRGTFTMRETDVLTGNHSVTPVEGIDFCNKGMNIPVTFRMIGVNEE